jgi:Holliday junction resolvase RusA-like endonuclease
MLIHEIKLPYPPSTNALWGIGRGRMFKTKKYAEWIERCKKEIVWEKKPPIDYPFEIEIVVGRKRNKDGSLSKVKADIDNRGKSTMDILEGIGVFINDHLAERVDMKWSTEFQGARIKIWKYEKNG